MSQEHPGMGALIKQENTREDKEIREGEGGSGTG
jgi:hypothetical protein